ncbi:MAG: hypothetical protein NW237_06510 [Cyanobacteriota bacterium]|nr:hypothetical protein [Cyanobacteriota bacterium]
MSHNFVVRTDLKSTKPPLYRERKEEQPYSLPEKDTRKQAHPRLHWRIPLASLGAVGVGLVAGFWLIPLLFDPLPTPSGSQDYDIWQEWADLLGEVQGSSGLAREQLAENRSSGWRAYQKADAIYRECLQKARAFETCQKPKRPAWPW